MNLKIIFFISSIQNNKRKFPCYFMTRENGDKQDKESLKIVLIQIGHEIVT